MKQTIRILASALLLLLMLILPAKATQLEAIYDETGLLASNDPASPESGSYDANWMEHEPGLPHVTDNAGILEYDQCKILEDKAKALEETYGFGVYIITVKDFRDYNPYDVFEAAVALYKKHSLGTGSEKEGLLLLMSMRGRDYSLITYSDRGNLTFNDEGRAAMTKFFLDDFRENRWYKGFWDYLDWSEEYLIAAQSGEPYSKSNLPMTAAEQAKKTAIRIAIVLLVPLVIAGIWVWILTAKMKSVARQTQAAAYAQGGLTLTHHSDIYTHTTETRVKIPKGNSKGGGRSRTSRSGGFSGTSGKF